MVVPSDKNRTKVPTVPGRWVATVPYVRIVGTGYGTTCSPGGG